MFARVSAIRIGFLLLWLVVVATGFAVILNYQNAPGHVGVMPQHWPANSRLSLDHNKDTLIMFAHPQCPCTRASIGELNRLLARSEGRVAAQVVFFKPTTLSTNWTRSGLWRSAAAIPRVTVVEDADGTQARLFGAETSGHVFLYDTNGQLLFQGGITGVRGHAGDNAGENAVVALLNGQTASLKESPVYGCSLLGECEAPPERVSK